MKSMFSYHFCEKYGEQQCYYLDVNSYNYNKRNQQKVRRLVHSLQKAISVPSQYAYINHSANTHHNIPLWVATNALTFGQISKMYQYGKQDLFAVVIALRYLISPEDFKAFKAGLTKSIRKVLKQCPLLTRKQLLNEMGFPENWEKIMRYKK